jgi:hypothetical protein
MDSTRKTLKAALEAIRDMASNALDQIEQSQETRSMRWVCKESLAILAVGLRTVGVGSLPKRIGLRSNIRLSGLLVNSSSITLPDVSTHLRPCSKAGRGSLTFAEAPLSAISRSNWTPSQPK